MGAYLVSSSDPIDRGDEAYEQIQPPQIQARNTYEKYLKDLGGRWFLVTMEEPNRAHHKPLIFEITAGGCSWRKISLGAMGAVTQDPPPRAVSV